MPVIWAIEIFSAMKEHLLVIIVSTIFFQSNALDEC